MALEQIKAEYVDHMGDDVTVVNAARVSFDKQSDWDLIIKDNSLIDVKLKARDRKLIRYLAKHEHWSPFAHCAMTLRETVPIFVARQRFKHTVGFSYNEISRRYVDDEPDFYWPGHFRLRADKKKQGSSDQTTDLGLGHYAKAVNDCQDAYDFLIETGVAPEQARMVLPQSMMTSYYVTGSLAAWARFYKLRSAEDSQYEIRDLAQKAADHLACYFPASWAALTEGE